MDPYRSKRVEKYKRSGAALSLLVLLGCGIIFFSIALIACSFVINYADDFQVDGDVGLEAIVQSQFSYCQYWAGVPFFVTGVLVLCSGIFQRSRGLTITATIFGITAVFIAVFVLSLDSANWNLWNNFYRNKLYWESKSGYSCETNRTGSCVCTHTSGTTRLIANYECDEISELSSLYGAVVGSSIVVAFLSTLAVLIIAKTLSWKRIRYSNRGYYADEFHTDTRRRTPSFVELPYARRGEYAERLGPVTGPPYK